MEVKIEDLSVQIKELSEKVDDLYKLKLDIERYEKENGLLDKRISAFDKTLIELTFEIREMKNNRLEDRDLRKEDRESMNMIMKQMNDLKQAVTNTSINYAKLATNQTNTNEKIDSLCDNVKIMAESLKGLENTPSKALSKAYTKSKVFRYVVNFILVLASISFIIICGKVIGKEVDLIWVSDFIKSIR